MNVTLYKYYAERDKVDKSTDLTFVASVTGQFKADVSILNPSLLLSLPAEGSQLLTDENGNLIADVQLNDIQEGVVKVLDFNYFYIEEFNRYYFLSSFVISSNRLVAITGEVDPLYSFKEQILENYAMIERNEFDYSPLQDDNLIPLELEKEIVEEDPVEGDLVNTHFSGQYDNDNPTYQFTISEAFNGGYETEIEGLGNNPDISTALTGDVGGQAVIALDKTNVSILISKLLGNFSAYASFFKSLTAYPFELNDRINVVSDVVIYEYKETNDPDTGEKVTSFEETSTGAEGCFIPSTSSYLVVADFELTNADSYLDYNPYTHYEVYLPFYGYYELPYNQIAGHRIVVYYSINYENGSGEVYV